MASHPNRRRRATERALRINGTTRKAQTRICSDRVSAISPVMTPSPAANQGEGASTNR
jgi:hypothetical protein